MTQQELSVLCDVDIRTIQRVESGQFGSGLHIVFALADAFKMHVSELLKEALPKVVEKANKSGTK